MLLGRTSHHQNPNGSRATVGLGPSSEPADPPADEVTHCAVQAAFVHFSVGIITLFTKLKNNPRESQDFSSIHVWLSSNFSKIQGMVIGYWSHSCLPEALGPGRFGEGELEKERGVAVTQGRQDQGDTKSTPLCKTLPAFVSVGLSCELSGGPRANGALTQRRNPQQ